MALISHKPITPSQRYLVRNRQELSDKRPERSLIQTKHRAKGRNCHGRITSRRRGGGHKRLYRIIDFKRSKLNQPASVEALEYDPNRSAFIALLNYEDGTKAYILAPEGLKVGDSIVSTDRAVEEYTPGLCVPLKFIPPATMVHAIEMEPGKGAQIARSAGISAQIMAVDGDKATLKMPSGEIRLVQSACRAVIGVVGNSDHRNQSLGKAGRNRWKGRRPRVRGVAMNPVDHPMGGGEGRTSGGGQPMSPWAQLSKGFPTRQRSKPSNSQILVRRNGKKVKKG
jgi:large subunit ribosomal protein L2